MNEFNRFTSFYDVCEDMFYEHLDNIKMYLKRNNEEYKTLDDKIKNILDNKNIVSILESDVNDTTLSTEECILLSKLLTLQSDRRDIEEKEIYFKGAMDLYYYFNKIGIIKG